MSGKVEVFETSDELVIVQGSCVIRMSHEEARHVTGLLDAYIRDESERTEASENLRRFL